MEMITKLQIKFPIKFQTKSQTQVPNQVPDPPPLNPFLPNTLVVPALLRPQLNWSHLKLEYAGKPDEDAEAHLLRTNDWMETHEFPDHVKAQRFCLTLTGEARL